MKKPLLIIIILIVIALIIPAIVFLNSQKEDGVFNFPGGGKKIQESSNASDAASKAGGGGGGGGSSKESIQSQNQESQNPFGINSLFCTKEQIAYSINAIEKTETCLESQLGVCTKKEATCKTEVKNLDSSAGGIFELSLVFFETDDRDNVFETKTSSKNINAKESALFIESTTLLDVKAEKNNSCLALTSKVPVKEVC